ncbi:MAG TPA: hypothetical protein VGR08_09060 [Thermomicrobiales bacterium]|nr:hypothetical protein [Thermomicrobiales bacterium]
MHRADSGVDQATRSERGKSRMTESDGMRPAPMRIDEEAATDLVWRAIEISGGTRSIYRYPRQAFSPQARRMVDVAGTPVEIRYGEISTPAVATVAGWVFEIHDEDIELLIRPPRPRQPSDES